jgi:CheY-like chemotaxis protein
MQLERASILVVDDEPDILNMLAFELRHEGYQVVTAHSGVHAVEAARRQPFDVVVTDLKMPGMDGVATVAALKQLDPDVEVMVATGYASVDTAVACMKGGASDYLCKPYDLSDLADRLAQALERRRRHGVLPLHEASRTLLQRVDDQGLASLILELALEVLCADGVALRMPLGQSVGAGGLAARATSRLAHLEEQASERPLAPILLEAAPGSVTGSAILNWLHVPEQPAGTLLAIRDAHMPPFGTKELRRAEVFAHQVALALARSSRVPDPGLTRPSDS